MRIRISAATLRNELVERVEEYSGQDVLACYQCGKCSAGCPMISSLDFLPNQVIRLVQLGRVQEVVNSKTIWMCASCYTCSERCPKGVDLAKVMEALRLLLLRSNRNYIDLEELEIEDNLPQMALVSNLRKTTG